MPSNESPSASTPGPRMSRVDSDPPSNVVWVRGEQDAATAGALWVNLAEATRLGDADVVVDLSGVTFMDASTIGALVRAGNALGGLSRCLSVRAPSPRARRVLDLCELEGLIDERPASPPTPTPMAAMSSTASALGSWVEVPARDRGLGSTPPLVAHEAPSAGPRCLMARRAGRPSRSILRRRAAS